LALLVIASFSLAASSAMNSQTFSPGKIAGLAAWLIALSAVAALVFLVGGHAASVRGPSGAVGFMAALVGSGVSGWFSFRARDRRLGVAALFSCHWPFGAG
jgi:hypothetical protein